MEDSTGLANKITSIKGVGAARARHLNRLGLFTLQDVLYYFPREYEDRTKNKKIIDTQNGETICIKGMCLSKLSVRRIRKGLTIYKVLIGDDTGKMYATWYNNQYVIAQLSIGQEYIFYGKVASNYQMKEMQNPIFEKAEGSHRYTQKIVPVYALTASITQKMMGDVVSRCLQMLKGQLVEFMPDSICKQYDLCEINQAISDIHYPQDNNSLNMARKRLVFEELLLLQLGLFYMRNKKQALPGHIFKKPKGLVALIKSLPFILTRAQQKVLDEILVDLQSGKLMNRLVQGDVGSGKTLVAMLAMYIAAQNGYQAALMAPTEILAEQHYESFRQVFGHTKISICLLTGSMSQKQKKLTTEQIEKGQIDMVIGTHTLIQESVTFWRLGLVVTDEQHRFGVKQRATLAAKGCNPHMIVMTATPIPRTLALILHGDLDVSIIDELPPGRKTVNTYAVDESKRQRLYTFLKKQVSEGRQIYIVCPLIEENENDALKAANVYAENLKQEILTDCNVGLLHGKLKPAEKEEIMRFFVNGHIDVLVATTVIEVGVNVPNATVMVIENAERFGLSQLHQLRGRVGRGQHQSYCVLFNNSRSKIARQRMQTMQATNDGFEISEKDLKLRGPGEFFGTRQHGLPDLKIANLFSDIDTLKSVQKAATDLLEHDHMLEKKEHQALKRRLTQLFAKKAEERTLN